MADQQKNKQSQTEIYQREGRRWPVLLGLLFAAFIVATAITFAGRWAYREIADNDNSQSSESSEFGELINENPSTLDDSADKNQINAESTEENNSENETNNNLPSGGDEALPSTGG